MALYARFYNLHDGQYVEGMGSDSVCRIDARLRLETAHNLAKDQMRRLRHVQQYRAYRLFRGRISQPSYITDILPYDPTA